MPNENELKQQISLYQKMLDILRQLLGLQTQLEKKQLEEMILSIAKEEGVDGELLLATIKCESGLNPRCINKNPNGSTDFGLCQFNDVWYWQKEKVISPDDALNKPEKAVRIMAKMFKKGRAKDWVCFSTKRYISFLSKKVG